jgi:ribulose-phosphate 3-epimerase
MMSGSGRAGEVEILPAILVKTRAEFLERVEQVRPFVKQVHVDVMDGVFVPNGTLGPDELAPLPTGIGYSFHWMVEKPEEGIRVLRGTHMHIIHIEALDSPGHLEEIKEAIRESGGRMGLSLSPDTPLEDVLPYKDVVSRFLVMSVVPGFYGQAYIQEVEPKIARLREECPGHDIEVDGGINFETAKRAATQGANMLASASTIFNSADVGEAIKQMKKAAEGG